MLARKSQLSNFPSGASLTLQRSSLVQAKTLAIRRQDYAEVVEIDAKLAELPALATPARNGGEESLNDKLAKVNERNRKANLEGIRKAEMLEAERKRRERKLNASGTATPADPSARLKTVPRLFNDTISRFVLTIMVNVIWSSVLPLIASCLASLAINFKSKWNISQIGHAEYKWYGYACTAGPRCGQWTINIAAPTFSIV
jgi:RNA polymerase-associated protein RTF1